MIGKLFVLLAAAWMLRRDFARDPGEHKRVKIQHAVWMIALVYFYTGSAKYIGWLIGNFDAARERLAVPLGFISGGVNFAAFVVHVCLSLVVLLCAAAMLNRSEKARALLVRLVPPLVLLEAVAFLRGWMSDGPAEIGPGWILFMGLALFGALGAGLLRFYRSSAAKAYFAFGPYRTTMRQAPPKQIEPIIPRGPDY